MRRTAWRIIGMVVLGIGGLVVALALTLGALALASDDLAGQPPVGGTQAGLSGTATPTADDEPTRTPSPTRSHTPSPSAGETSDDPSGSDDHGGDSSGHGSGGSDSSGPGSGPGDRSADD